MKRLILLVVLAVGLTALFIVERTDDHAVPAGAMKLVDLDPAQVARLEIQGAKGRMVLVRQGDDWRLIEPVDGLADRKRVDALVGVLAALNSDGVISHNADKAALFAVDDVGGIRVDLFYAPNAPPRATLMVGKLSRDFTHTYVVRRDGGHHEVHRVSGPLRLQLDQPSDAWRNRRVLHFAPGDITRLTLTQGDDHLTLTQGDDGWDTDRSGQERVPAKRVDDQLLRLLGLSALSFVDAPVPLGDAPLLTISLWKKGQDNPIDLVIEAKMPTGYRVVADSDPQRFVVPADGLAELVENYYSVLGLKAP